MNQDIAKILLSEEEIKQRVFELGKQISEDYQGKDVVVVGVLRGAFVFLADLVRAIEMPVAIDFISVSSYGSGTSSTGVVRFLKDLDEEVSGRHVLLVEDIIDSGITLKYLLENMKTRKPLSVCICTLLSKPERRKVEIDVAYNGFTIPDHFVVGYGLDYSEKYRNLPYVGILDPKIYE